MSDDVTSPKIHPLRAPRVTVTALHRVSFNLIQPFQAKELALSNVSTSGLGFLKSEALQALSLGTSIQGHLIFENRGFPTKLKIAHRTGAVIGSAFEPDPRLPMIQEAIRGIFRIELAALSTMKVSSKYHKSEPDGDAHWIHGDNADLYYVMSGDELLRFRMTFLGNYFEAGRDRALTAGQIIEDTRIEVMKGTELLKDKELTPETIDLALKFLENVPHLPSQHRQGIASYFAPARPSAS